MCVSISTALRFSPVLKKMGGLNADATQHKMHFLIKTLTCSQTTHLDEGFPVGLINNKMK